jgi:Zn-dependent protease/predicted transcriptional regulator
VRSQIRLGRIFGIEIGLHYSWFLIALLIVFSLSGTFHTGHPQWSDGLVLALAIATALLFFVSLLLHELAHSLVAVSNGLPVRGITLFALGGVSQIERGAASAKTEFWMALVGPLTSLLIGLSCIGVVRIAGGAPAPLLAVLTWLGYINLGLAGFNMIPGFPLDGGRVLRAAIWWKTGDADRSTREAARVGQVVAALFIAIGIVQFFMGAGIGGLWIAFIGWFLLQASAESYREVGLKRALDKIRVADLMSRDCPTVNGNMNLQDFVDEHLLRTGRRCFIVLDKDGHVAGLITPHEIKQADRATWKFKRLDDVMRPLDEMRTVPPDALLTSALEMMSRDDLNQIPVVSNGHLEGILSRADILSYLQTKAELHAGAGRTV